MGWIENSVLNSKDAPAIYEDILGNIPAYNLKGMLFVSTDTFALYRNNGAGWDLIGGPGTGTITGSGTIGTITKFTGSATIGDSIITENAGTINVNGRTIISANSPYALKVENLASASNPISIYAVNTNNNSYVFASGNGVTISFYVTNSGIISGTKVINSTSDDTYFLLGGGGTVLINTYLTTTAAGTTYVPYTGATGGVNLGSYNITATQLIKAGGTSAQFLKADGSVDSNTYLTTTAAGTTYVPYTGATGGVNLGSYNITATQLIKAGGTSAQFLKADGSVDSNTYLTTTAAGTTYVPYTGATGGVDLGTNYLRTNLIYNGTTSTNILTLQNYSGSTVTNIIDGNGLTIGSGSGSLNTRLKINSTYSNPSGLIREFWQAPILDVTSTTMNTQGIVYNNTLTISATTTQNITGLLTNISTNFTIASGATTTVTTTRGIVVNINNNSSSAIITNAVGLNINPFTATGTITNTTYLLTGTATPQTGNWNIYSSTAYNNYLGTGATSINTATNTYKLNVVGTIYDSETQTTLNQSLIGVLGGLNFNTTGTETNQYANAATYGTFIYNNASGTFTPYASAIMGGIVGSNQYTGGGTFAGTCQSVLAAIAFAGTVNVTTAAGFRVLQPQQLAGGAAYTGTVTNMVGVYIDDISGSGIASKFTNKYGIYQAGGSDKNFFNGEIQLGTGQVVSASVLNTVTNKIKLIVNGTTYYLLASTSGA